MTIPDTTSPIKRMLKADAVDARMLALFAPKPRDLRLGPLSTPQTAELRGSRQPRGDLAQIIYTEQNRLEHPHIQMVEQTLQRDVRTMIKKPRCVAFGQDRHGTKPPSIALQHLKFEATIVVKTKLSSVGLREFM